MTPRHLAYLLLLPLLFAASTGLLKGQVKQANKEASYGNTVKAQRPQPTLSFRIENGQCYINNALVPQQELPAGLRNLDNAIFYQTAVYGMQEIAFDLFGKTYLVRADRVSEAPSRGGASRQTSGGYTNSAPPQQAAEEYYGQLKRESPTLFYSLSREGALYEQARRLLSSHQVAKGKERDAIREEMRTVFSQLFDINERNRELEIRELEDLIESAKKEVMFRKANKGAIIENALDELLD